MSRNQQNKKPLELYLHIPFCIRKCAYCDFLSGPWDTDTQHRYTEALIQEIRAAAETAKEREITTIFFGGGTPSILEPPYLASILEELNKDYQISPDAEISMEANPGTLSGEKLQHYREMGINRLSIGLQSTVEKELKRLGRIHTFPEFLNNYAAAREAGFDNLNVDLMFALPEQTRESWQKTLKTVAALLPEHLSAYSLIVEEGTPFAEQELNLPDEDTEYAMYEDTAEILQEYGFHQYEISNYAKPGRECRHNVGYWERTDYLGFGLGASSLWTEGDGTEQIQKRFHNTTRMSEYLTSAGEPGALRREVETLSVADAMAEFLFLGLRMTKGVSEVAFREAFGRELYDVYGDVIKKYEAMQLLSCKDHRVSLTRAGIHVSNAVMADFLPE